jgi:ammonium transporter, Amt family
VSALVLAIIVGRRAGFLTADRSGASPELALIGAGLIWAGWLGLSGGMALGASDDAASAIINTHIAACAAALIWAGLDRYRSGAISVTGVAMGAVSGLVAISAGATYIAPAWAILIGVIGGATAYFAANILRNRFLVDDSLNIFAVHGAAGIVGSLLIGIFLSERFNGGGLPADTGIAAQLGIQAMGIVLVAIWSVIGTLIAGYGSAMLIPMRSDDTSSKAE